MAQLICSKQTNKNILSEMPTGDSGSSDKTQTLVYQEYVVTLKKVKV